MDEVNILKKISHPNIIGIKDVFETDTKMYLVLELYVLAHNRTPTHPHTHTHTHTHVLEQFQLTELYHHQSVVLLVVSCLIE
jgi:serine/threonine protein kinase